MKRAARIKGLVALVRDAVDGGSKAIQKVQLATAKRTFDVLEAVPLVSEPTRAVRVVHDASVVGTHTVIRLVNGAVGGVATALLDAFLAQEEQRRNNDDGEPKAGSPSE